MLQAMDTSALAAHSQNPARGVFVEYTELPEAVPEYLYTEHFAVPDDKVDTLLLLLLTFATSASTCYAFAYAIAQQQLLLAILALLLSQLSQQQLLLLQLLVEVHDCCFARVLLRVVVQLLLSLLLPLLLILPLLLLLLLLSLLQAVDWRALMATTTAHYSKDTGSRKKRSVEAVYDSNGAALPTADADAKHAAAVPEMHTAAVTTGLLDSYKQLQSMQKWRKAEAAEEAAAA
jgi:hypothetical protein